MSTELKTLNGYGFDATKLGGLDAQYYAQGRAAHNLLVNSWFVNPVNQRGFSSTTSTGDTMSLDRWLFSVNSGGSISLTASGLVCENANLIQKIESKLLNSAKEYTQVFWLADGTPIFPTKWIEFNYSSGVGRVVYYGITGTVVAAALYEGAYTADTLPAYVPKGYAAELAECQRYYKHQVLLHAVKTSGNTYLVSKSFDVPMRAVPTYSFVKADVYGIGTFNDFTECYLSLDGAGVYYAILPTLTSYNNVGLVVNFSCDL